MQQPTADKGLTPLYCLLASTYWFEAGFRFFVFDFVFVVVVVAFRFCHFVFVCLFVCLFVLFVVVVVIFSLGGGRAAVS